MGCPPKRTVEEMAAKLREEIARYDGWLKDSAARRQRASDRFSDQLETAAETEKPEVLKKWGEANARFTAEQERFSAQRGEHRRLLQRLTGELWS